MTSASPFKLATANGKQTISLPVATEFDESSRQHGCGEPPHNDRMEARVTALEEAVKNLPTKADFAELRADMHKNTVEVQRWMIATVIALFLGFSGLFFTMNNSTKPAPAISQAAPQQPIIINVPAASQAPVAPAAPQQQ